MSRDQLVRPQTHLVGESGNRGPPIPSLPATRLPRFGQPRNKLQRREAAWSARLLDESDIESGIRRDCFPQVLVVHVPAQKSDHAGSVPTGTDGDTVLDRSGQLRHLWEEDVTD